MNFTRKQINQLITGTKLACELPPSSMELKHFLTIVGYEINEHGRPQGLSKFLNTSKQGSALFEVKEYEVPISYLENNWDITEDEWVNYVCKDGICGIVNAEIELSKRNVDFSFLQPEWYCDNPL